MNMYYGQISPVFIVIILVVVVITIAGMWKMFEKAGQPGWAVLVPIYNAILLCEIAKKPSWWVVLMLIPIVNLVVIIMLYSKVAENFGKDPVGFTIGMLLLPYVFLPILGFGDAVYNPTGEVVEGKDEMV